MKFFKGLVLWALNSNPKYIVTFGMHAGPNDNIIKTHYFRANGIERHQTPFYHGVSKLSENIRLSELIYICVERIEKHPLKDVRVLDSAWGSLPEGKLRKHAKVEKPERVGNIEYEI